MADKKEEDRKEDDERLEFIYRYLVLSRKIKVDKWVKMLANEEYKVFFLLNLNQRLFVKIEVCLYGTYQTLQLESAF